ncbi:MAG: DUF2809 domain-containing protein [Propioniciclava sp.]|uniref:ribosomal maturation YjgA family protein n=1 Tax=Propioniciclava sp. TaxID=2038686 RepID=UPI0039E307D7
MNRGRVRIRVGVAVVATIAVGMVGRSLPWVGNALGGIAYTVLIALLIALVWPAVRPVVAASVATGASVAVELLQLTPIPRTLVGAAPALRWVFGSTFAWEDMLWYAAGGLVAFGVVALIRAALTP